jgi:TPP-dependent pyruvate/acetoin dehydrogenase alpha subunit
MAFHRATKNTSVASRGAAYGLPGVEVDGQDVSAVDRVAKQAIERARSGGGPTLIECKTYRYVGHHEGDPGTDYRTRDEVNQWREMDPTKRARKTLLESGRFTEAELKQVDGDVTRLIDEAVHFAETSPEPSVDTLMEHVF